MTTIIQIQARTVYGQRKIYPMNRAAEILARIAGTKTLSQQNLKDAEALGLRIEEVFEPLDLSTSES